MRNMSMQEINAVSGGLMQAPFSVETFGCAAGALAGSEFGPIGGFVGCLGGAAIGNYAAAGYGSDAVGYMDYGIGVGAF